MHVTDELLGNVQLSHHLTMSGAGTWLGHIGGGGCGARLEWWRMWNVIGIVEDVEYVWNVGGCGV